MFYVFDAQGKMEILNRKVMLFTTKPLRCTKHSKFHQVFFNLGEQRTTFVFLSDLYDLVVKNSVCHSKAPDEESSCFSKRPDPSQVFKMT
jgi:hypothetical protein